MVQVQHSITPPECQIKDFVWAIYESRSITLLMHHVSCRTRVHIVVQVGVSLFVAQVRVLSIVAQVHVSYDTAVYIVAQVGVSLDTIRRVALRHPPFHALLFGNSMFTSCSILSQLTTIAKYKVIKTFFTVLLCIRLCVCPQLKRCSYCKHCLQGSLCRFVGPSAPVLPCSSSVGSV